MRRPPRRTVALLAGAAVASIVAGCGSSPTPSPGSSSTGPGSSAASSPASSGLDSASPPPASPATAVADPDLFEVLPDTSDVFSLIYDPVTTATIASDPALDPAVDSIATGLYRPRDAAPDPPDFAIVNVVHLRDPSLGDDWFRSWRETYDESACEQAGGVVRRAETPVGALTVYVGSCEGGAFTYHARLNEGNVILSMTSVGPTRIGQTVAERLGR